MNAISTTITNDATTTPVLDAVPNLRSKSTRLRVKLAYMDITFDQDSLSSLSPSCIHSSGSIESAHNGHTNGVVSSHITTIYQFLPVPPSSIIKALTEGEGEGAGGDDVQGQGSEEG
jgi:hypothetical protein